MLTRNKLSFGYLEGIDGLRAVAVLAVILFHLDSSFLPGGFTGVDVFFVISGYVISKSLSNKTSPGFFSYLGDFYKRRFIRIIPALLFCLVVTTILTTLFVPASWLSKANDYTGLAAFFGVSNLVLVNYANDYFSPAAEFNPFLHTWSLAVEEQFYLFFPILFYFWIHFRTQSSIVGILSRTLLFILAVVSLAYAWYETSRHPDRAFFLLPSRFWELAAGAVLFKLHSGGLCVSRSKNTSEVFLILGGILVAAGFFFSERASFPFPWAILPVSGTVLMICGVVNTTSQLSLIHKALKSTAVVYIGKLSYSLYLWHWPVFTLFRWTVGLETIETMLIGVMITTVMSIVSYHFVETPIRRNQHIRVQIPWKVVTLSLAVISLSCLASYIIFKKQPVISLSVTKEADLWRPWIPIDEASVDGNNRPDNERRNNKLYVIGDSHAAAYRLMVQQASQQLGVEYELYTEGGCHVLALYTPTRETKRCREFVEQSLALIEKAAMPGDIIFFASLRVGYLRERGGEIYDEEDVIEALYSPESIKQREKAITQASDIIQRFARKEVHVLIDAPKPIFQADPFRCSDWFNNMNPDCVKGLHVKRDFLLKFRQPIMKSIEILINKHKNVVLWDPFDALCGTDICVPYDNGTPVFFDADHISGYGNKKLLPSFKAVLNDIWRGQI